MTRITFALATVLSLAFTPLAAQETNCDGWSQSGWEVAQPFWEAATVDIAVSRTGYITETASKRGVAKIAFGLTTRFGTPTYKTSTMSFTVKISNYDPNYEYDITSNYGTLSIGTPVGSTLLLTVTGLNSKTLRNTKISVTTSRTGYASVTSSFIS